MPVTVDVPNLGEVEFPDEMSSDDIEKSLRSQFGPMDASQQADMSKATPEPQARQPMGPMGPLNPEELLALPQILKAPAAALEQTGLGQSLEDVAADFLRRTGINPAAQAGEPLAPKREDTTYIPSPLEEAFPEVGAGLEQAARGFTTPGQVAALPFAGLKPVQTAFGAQMTAAIPESVQSLMESRGTTELVKSLADLGINLAGAKLLPRALKSLERVTEEKPDASSIQEATTVHGDLRPQPVQGEGQVPTTEGSGGVQPQATTGVPEAQVGVTPEVSLEKAPPSADTGEAPQQAPSAGKAMVGEAATSPTEPASPEPTAITPVTQGVEAPTPEMVGLGGALKEGEIPETGAGAEKYGVAARVREERAQAGQVEPVEPGEIIGTEEQIKKYRDIVKSDPTAGPRALEAFEADPKKQISTDLEGITRAHGESLFAKARDIEEKSGTDSPQWREANEAANNWDKRTKPIQTAWSEIGHGQMGETDLDSGSYTGLNRAFREYSERDIPKEIKPAAEKIAKVNREAKAKADLLTEQVNNLFQEDAIEPHVTSLANRIASALDKTANDALTRIKARRAEGRLFTGIDPVELADYAVYGASKIAKGALDFSKWSVDMVKDIGDYITPHLKQIWDASNKHLDDVIEKSTPAKERPNVSRTIRKQSAVDAERAALDAAHKTVREAAARLEQTETKDRVDKAQKEVDVANVQRANAEKALQSANEVVKRAAERSAKAQRNPKERVKLKEQEKAAMAAVESARKVVRDAAIKAAQAENKVRVASAVTESDKARMASSKKALDAANRAVTDAATRLAKEESRVKERVILNEQQKADDAALEAANKAARDSAVAKAEAENKARVSKSKIERDAARVQAKNAQKALDAANKSIRVAAERAAIAERKNRADPIKRVWDAVRGYLNNGETDPDVIRTKVATDLGLSTEKVYRIMAQDNRAKYLMDEMWKARQSQRRLKQNAKRWVQSLDDPQFKKYLSTLPSAMFKAKVWGHIGVALGTHAPAVGFQPKFWKTYFDDYKNMWKMGLSRTTYERMIGDLQNRPNFVRAQRYGLDNDPHTYEEYNSPAIVKWASDQTGMGSRGYTVLKLLRQDLFDKVWDNLPRTQQIDEVGWAIADHIDTITGTINRVNPPKALKGRMAARLTPPEGSSAALFAPTLLTSRFNWLFADSARTANILTHWKTATPGEKMSAKLDINSKLWVAGTGLALLTINAGILAALGSKQKVNFTDPTRSDWLKFKAFGMNFAYGNALLSMARFIPREIATIAGGKNVKSDEDFAKKGWEFARSQLSPFAGTAADLGFGADYSGRPLPRKLFGLVKQNQKVPLRQREEGIKPYTWSEYGLQTISPIPFQEGLKEVWKEGWGMSDAQVNAYLKAAAISAIMGTTGGRVSEDYTLKKPHPTYK